MTAPVRGTGGDRDDGYDGYDDDWEPVLDEEVRGPLPPPPDTAAGVRCPGCVALVLPGTPRCPRCLARIGGGGGGGRHRPAPGWCCSSTPWPCRCPPAPGNR
ncbi:hypothetical protein ACFQ2K_29885 [Streptomyces sanglieri]|uniref:Zinc ribbon domain-containing protein n=1 Tax=Streptomyces sanglieri TaxID=193460 RepID=A0ABW2X259_9ACTN